MLTKISRRVWFKALAPLVTAIALTVGGMPHSAAAAPVYPNSIGAAGDSITRAFDSGPIIPLDQPANSWTTGTNTTINSMYNRFLAVNPAIYQRNFNLAKTGAVVGDLVGQMTTLNLTHPDYVTILIGANDVCASSEANMTSVQNFRTRFQAGIDTLRAGTPNARIYVLSIPNVYNLWSLFKNNANAQAIWSGFSVCQSMLVNPTSTAQADVDRRARVRQRNIDFNTQLQQVCAQYAQCRFDNNALFNTTFLTSDVSTLDYFHPSIAGQAKLAAVAWGASGF